MKRRSLLKAGLGSVLAAIADRAKANFGIFQVNGPGAGGFVPTLQAIDGGPTWYASNGFTVGATAGFDTKIEIAAWPADLIVAADYNLFGDLGLNSGQLINGGSSQTLAGTGSANLVYWNLLCDYANTGPGGLATLFTNIGAETISLSTWDEPTDWSSQVGGMMQGNLSPQRSYLHDPPTNACTGRPFWTDTTFGIYHGPLGTTPGAGTVAAGWSATVTAPDGNTRRSDMISNDYYWIAAASDPSYLCSPVTGGAELHGLGGSPDGGVSYWNTSSSSITLPNSGSTFPYDIPFTTNAGRAFQIGATVLICRGGGGSYSSAVGTLTAYNKLTGAATVRVATANRTYTASQNAGVNVFTGSPTVAATFCVTGTDTFVGYGLASFGFTPVVTATGGHIPGGTVINIVDALGTNAAGTNREFEFRCSANTTVVAGDTITVPSMFSPGGDGPFTSWNIHVAMTKDQCRRVHHCGDLVDAQRAYQFGNFPAPILQFLECTAPFQNCINQSDATTADELYSLAWAAIAHGALRLTYFQANYGGPDITQTCLQHPTVKTIVSGNTISIYDRVRATNTLIQKLAPVIRSQFANNFATVSPGGFIAPFPGSYVTNNTTALDKLKNGPPVFNANLATDNNGNNIAAFEICSKQYVGSITGLFTKSPQYWMIVVYRGSAADTNITATVSIANVGSATVTRVYSDGVIGAATSPAGSTTLTRITTSRTDMISNGDTVQIEQTTCSGVAAGFLNGTFTVSNVLAGPPATFDITGNFTGGTLTHNGVVTMLHNIPVVSGGFTDIFTRGTDVRIYRAN